MASYKVYSKDKVDEKIKAVTDDIETGLESLGETVNANYDMLEELISKKQDKLTAGSNIRIVDNVISATNSVGAMELFLANEEGEYGKEIDNPVSIGLDTEDVSQYIPLSKIGLRWHKYVVEGYDQNGNEYSIILLSKEETTEPNETFVYKNFVSGVGMYGDSGYAVYDNGEHLCVYEGGEKQIVWNSLQLKK